MGIDRQGLLAATQLTGTPWCQAHTRAVDLWLGDLLSTATDDLADVALVAVGGYGRAELCPYSDVDVMLLHRGGGNIASVAERIWYPVWDEGIHLGHRVATLTEVLKLAADDLDTATSLLSTRHVAGSSSLTDELADRAKSQWNRRAKLWAERIAASSEERHARFGEISHLLEPDLKEGHGGLRDVHALAWADASEKDDLAVTDAYETLLRARVELHRHTRRATNVLVLEDQPSVARAVGAKDVHELMMSVASAASTIAWTADITWRRLRKHTSSEKRSRSRHRQLAPGIVLRDGDVAIDGEIAGDDALLALRMGVAAARNHTLIERESLEVLAAQARPLGNPWPPGARELFVDLLQAGRPAIPVIESLDQRGVWETVLPEWAAVRSRPQRNAVHRFTVDRHLLETVAGVAGFSDQSGVLVIAAILHDLGKGRDGDHTEIGVDLARTITPQMGLDQGEQATVLALVAHHLLLAEVATRRDLDDPTTIAAVAEAIGSVERLRLLAALTEADARAAGPAAWGEWKRALVIQLTERVERALTGASIPAPVNRDYSTVALAEGRIIEPAGNLLTVVDQDRPGLFSRIAGVLALHGLDVYSASAHSPAEGRAMAQFVVHNPLRRETPWPKVTSDLNAVLEGRLALDARLNERARTYRARPALTSLARVGVRFHNDASENATVIEVHAPDHVGVLYRITRALAELDLDIRSAKVETQGTQVVDSFYVTARGGLKITEQRQLDEIEKAILFSVSEWS